MAERRTVGYSKRIHKHTQKHVPNPVFMTLVHEVLYSICPGHVVSLMEGLCLVPKLAYYSFYSAQRDENLSEICQPGVETSTCCVVDMRTDHYATGLSFSRYYVVFPGIGERQTTGKTLEYFFINKKRPMNKEVSINQIYKTGIATSVQIIGVLH